MQSFNTRHDEFSRSTQRVRIITVGRAEDIPRGQFIAVELPDGTELALYNFDGEFYATTNFCPHKGARLSDGLFCGHIVECGLHGWQFDVRNGSCHTVPERLETYRASVEDGMVRVEVKFEDQK